MDLRRTVGVKGSSCPTTSTSSWPTADFERFEAIWRIVSPRADRPPCASTPAGSGYQFLGPVEVILHEDPDLSVSTFAIESEMVEGDDGPTDWLVFPDGRRVGIGSQVLTIGRLPECAIVLDDPNVSRRHAQIRREGTPCSWSTSVRRTGPVSTARSVREHRLVSGDVISVGTTALRFEPS